MKSLIRFVMFLALALAAISTSDPLEAPFHAKAAAAATMLGEVVMLGAHRSRYAHLNDKGAMVVMSVRESLEAKPGPSRDKAVAAATMLRVVAMVGADKRRYADLKDRDVAAISASESVGARSAPSHNKIAAGTTTLGEIPMVGAHRGRYADLNDKGAPVWLSTAPLRTCTAS